MERRLAFYNSFSGFIDRANDTRLDAWQVEADDLSGEIFALRRHGFETMQFHPESILSIDGVVVLKEALKRLFDHPAESAEPSTAP